MTTCCQLQLQRCQIACSLAIKPTHTHKRTCCGSRMQLVGVALVRQRWMNFWRMASKYYAILLHIPICGLCAVEHSIHYGNDGISACGQRNVNSVAVRRSSRAVVPGPQWKREAGVRTKPTNTQTGSVSVSVYLSHGRQRQCTCSCMCICVCVCVCGWVSELYARRDLIRARRRRWRRMRSLCTKVQWQGNCTRKTTTTVKAAAATTTCAQCK